MSDPTLDSSAPKYATAAAAIGGDDDSSSGAVDESTAAAPVAVAVPSPTDATPQLHDVANGATDGATNADVENEAEADSEAGSNGGIRAAFPVQAVASVEADADASVETDAGASVEADAATVEADVDADAHSPSMPAEEQPEQPGASDHEQTVATEPALTEAPADPVAAEAAPEPAPESVAEQATSSSPVEAAAVPETESTEAAVVPPPRTPHVARSGSSSPSAAPASSVPVHTVVDPAPFMPPPPCDPVLFHSPALRYSLADALAVPAMRQQAAGGVSTVFQPLANGGAMFDLSAGSVLIEDYSAPPPPQPQPQPAAATSVPSKVDTSTPPPSSSSTPAPTPSSSSSSSSSTQSTTTRVLSSMFSSFSSLFGQSALGLLTVSGKTASSGRNRSASHSPAANDKTGSASATERSASPSLSPLSSSPSSSPPNSSAHSGVATATEGGECGEDEEGFSASGPCIYTVARSYVPLPTDGLALADCYDPTLTARGALWIQQLNPMQLRRQFAPGLYLRLLGARAQPSANGAANASGSDDEVPVQTPEESHVETYIRKDLARTFPNLPLFSSRYGLSVLFNVLRAFAHFDPAVSYSQGMAFIVGTLMLHYGPPDRLQAAASAAAAVPAATASAAPPSPSSSSSSSASDGASLVVASSSAPAASAAVPSSNPSSSSSTTVVVVPPSPSSGSSSSASSTSSSPCLHGGESEELLFFSLVQLMSDRKHNLRSLYSDDCVGLRLILSVFSSALDHSDPVLSAHLRDQGVDVSLYATPWFVSCFAYRFSLPFTSACFGHFVNVGLYFLVLCALHVLRHLRAALLSKPFDLLVPFLTMAALPDLPHDLPDQAFAQGTLPDHLMQRLQPKHTRQSSYKTRR